MGEPKLLVVLDNTNNIDSSIMVSLSLFDLGLTSERYSTWNGPPVSHMKTINDCQLAQGTQIGIYAGKMANHAFMGVWLEQW